MPHPSSRMVFIDVLRALASQLIVLHHLAFYGPMSDHARSLAPQLFRWLRLDARMAVQVFLVIGGFLAARSLAPAGHLTPCSPLKLLGRRYVKLAIPCLAAVLLCIPCAAAARTLMTHDSIPHAPTLAQIIAHAFLLQDILGYEGLSAGCWYVAIDFQLFALLLGLLWLVHLTPSATAAARRANLCLVILLALTSLFYFNRDAAWDVWAVYFFGSYALGVLAYWLTARQSKLSWWLLMILVVGMALLTAWRWRIVVALVTALALGMERRWTGTGRIREPRIIAWLGKISYSVFLVHFSVCLLVNSLFARFAGPDPWLNAAGIGLAWAGSIAAGALFYRGVEGRIRFATARTAGQT